MPLNLPNLLTVLRIMLVPVLVVALLGNTPSGDVLAAVVFALASLTDFIDGYLARSRDSITTFGKLMDPLADKLLIVGALLSLVSLDRLEGWVAMVIIARELAVTMWRMNATSSGVVIEASMFGKLKTCVQIAAILAVIAVPGSPLWVSLLVYLMVAITVLSGLDYFRRATRPASSDTPPAHASDVTGINFPHLNFTTADFANGKNGSREAFRHPGKLVNINVFTAKGRRLISAPFCQLFPLPS